MAEMLHYAQSVPDFPRATFSHEDTAHLTVDQQTDIRMPGLGEETSFCAMFVLEDDVPNKMINEVLEKVAEEACSMLWVAEDNFNNVESVNGTATKPPLRPNWQSPFVGKTVEEAFRFMSTVPMHVSIHRGHIAVLDKHFYEDKGWVLVYGIDGEGLITCAPCDAGMCYVYMATVDTDRWEEDLEEWQYAGQPVLGAR